MLFLLLAALSVGTTMQAHADELTAAKKADIRKLMHLVGDARLTDQFVALTTQTLRQSLRTCTNCTLRTFDVIEHETHGLFHVRMDQDGGLTDRMITIYHRHFSQPEIQQLIAFYTTPLGKRLLEETPQIGQESLVAGQQWGRALGPELENRIKLALAKEKLPMPAVPSQATSSR
jgi:hypothetical protein